MKSPHLSPTAGKRLRFLATASGLCLASALLARESWPAPTEEAKQQEAAYKQHEDEVIKRALADAPAWAAKGKPYLPGAKEPGDLPQAKVPAFPGAEGGGKYSFGGRGGKVFVVSTLDDSGPGSLREACEATGPRVVIFNVAGIIHLRQPIFIESPYITIAGQTAPGDGICIADQGIVDNAHDVVIRYLRLRRGNTDIFNRHGTHYGSPIGNIIIDHCSASWGADQNIDTYRHMYDPPEGGPTQKLPAVNVTIQWTITSEALNTYNHAFGGDWGGRNSGFHHNLFASNTGRNPSVAMSYDFNFVNNVLFNWRHRSVDGGNKDSLYNIINNYYKPGPATPQGDIRHRILLPSQSWSKADPINRWGKAYVAGNVVEGAPEVTKDNWNGGVQFNLMPEPDASGVDAKSAVHDKADTDKLAAGVRVDKPFPMPDMTITSAEEAYQAVLANAGATLPHRDPVDTRVIETVRTGVTWAMGQSILVPMRKGLAKNNQGIAGDGIITDVNQVGGYPEYKGTPRGDLGADGIPASWKAKYKLDAKDPDLANKDLKGDGYTVLDKYLDGLDPTEKIDWSKPGSNVNTLTEASLR